MQPRQKATRLQSTIARLEDLGLIKNFEILDRSKEKARLILPNDQKIVIFVGDDIYIITYMQIREIWNQTPPPPDYIVYDEWDYDTKLGLAEAKAKGMNVIKFDKFCNLLNELLNDK